LAKEAWRSIIDAYSRMSQTNVIKSSMLILPPFNMKLIQYVKFEPTKINVISCWIINLIWFIGLIKC